MKDNAARMDRNADDNSLLRTAKILAINQEGKFILYLVQIGCYWHITREKLYATDIAEQQQTEGEI